MQTIVFLLAFAALGQAGRDLVQRYVQAIGGEAAVRAIRTRVTTGEFDNGRGLVTPFRIVEQAPNRRVVIIGTHPIDSREGSGRGFDGETGWDKNFIGTGLRVVEGLELAELRRDSDMLRPLHLLDECQTTATESAAGRGIVTCSMPSGAPTRLHFDSGSGFLLEQESTTANGRTPIRVLFEDYRQVDAVRLPFRTRIILPGATITYSVTAVRHDEPVQDAVFRRPRAQ